MSKKAILVSICMIVLFAIAITISTVCVYMLIYCEPEPSPYQDIRTGYVSYPKLGSNGRLGNQMFQIAATVGFGASLDKFVEFSPVGWNHTQLFDSYHADIFKLNEKLQSTSLNLQEQRCFWFEDNESQASLTRNKNANVAIDGYRQNIRYFTNSIPEIRRMFRISRKLKNRVKLELLSAASKLAADTKLIGVHVRRGDYANHPVHDVCCVNYFILGIHYFRKMFDPNALVVIITDDKDWCKKEFENAKLENYIISPFQTEHDDFVCLNICNFKVISNSTFAYWAAFLDNRFNSQVFVPKPWINDQDVDYDNFFDKRWITCDCNAIKDEAKTTEIKKMDKMTDQKGDKKAAEAKQEKKQINQSILTNHEISAKSELVLPVYGAFYQCYRQPRAFIESCTLYREVYPTGTLVIVNDAGDNFLQASKYFNADSYITNSFQSGNGKTTCLNDLEKIKLFVFNFIRAAKMMKEEFFMLLEDDVSVLRPISAKIGGYDIVGNNNNTARFNEGTMKLLKSKGALTTKSQNMYMGCGGSLFRSAFWSSLRDSGDDLLTSQLIEFAALNDGVYHSDIVLAYLCLANHGTICCGQEEFPTEFAEKRPLFGSPTYPAVLHMEKRLYNTNPTELDFEIIDAQSEEER